MSQATSDEHRSSVAGRLQVRPLELDDLAALALIDERYCARLGAEQVVSRASINYFLRSGHSFVVEEAPAAEATHERPPELSGFLLAHAVWSGSGAVVRVERLALATEADGAQARASSLTEAVVKSAYDAGVYRLVATTPSRDATATAALAAAEFTAEASVVHLRLLGSGGLSGQNTAGDGDNEGRPGTTRRGR